MVSSWGLAGVLIAAGVASTEAVTLTMRSRSHNRARANPNPIRKIVTMLQAMDKQITEESTVAEELFKKSMCFCKESGESLQASVKIAEERIASLESSIEETNSHHTQLEQDLKKHQSDRAEAEEALAAAEGLRKKAVATFAKESAEAESNIESVQKALQALEGGVPSGFLQTHDAEVLKTLSVTLDMDPSARDTIASFLSAREENVPAGAEIIGILKQMYNDMVDELKQMESDEAREVANHEALEIAKKKEIAAATQAVEEKMGRAGEGAVQLVTLKSDLQNTRQALVADNTFLSNLEASCKTKETEFKEFQAVTSNEKIAIGDTIKILSEDDAVELFKKTLDKPAPSFLQAEIHGSGKRRIAAKLLHGKGDRRLDFIALALRGQKKGGFEKVIQQCDELRKVLQMEEKNDEKKKAFCEAEIGKTEDEKGAKDRAIADLKTVIASTKESLSGVKNEIDALIDGIKQLDVEVAKMTNERKAEHAENLEVMTASNSAKQLLDFAKQRLKTFYGSMQATKKTAESGGVFAMIDMLIADLAKKATEIEVQEKNDQADYERFITDSSDKRMVDSKAVAAKEGTKADMEAKIAALHENLRLDKAAALDVGKELDELHSDCDWFLSNFDNRKQARSEELDNLDKAKAVLSGADYQ